MDETYQEKHGAFVLKCAPMVDPQGRYLPRLVATKLDRSGPHDIEVSLPDAGPFPVASAAADFALDFGKRWVRERLMRPTEAGRFPGKS